MPDAPQEHITVRLPGANGATGRTDNPATGLGGLPPPPEPLVVPGGPQAPDLSDAEPDELRRLEVDIAAYTFGQDRTTRQQVARCEIPRLVVPRQAWADGQWYVVRATSNDPQGRWRAGEAELEAYNFRVHGLDADDFKECERRSTQPVQNSVGMVVRRERDDALFNAMCIYLATVPEDKAKPGCWDDRAMWERYKVGNGPMLIKEMLLMGELVAALRTISHMSRFAEQQEDLLGNSYAPAGS